MLSQPPHHNNNTTTLTAAQISVVTSAVKNKPRKHFTRILRTLLFFKYMEILTEYMVLSLQIQDYGLIYYYYNDRLHDYC